MAFSLLKSKVKGPKRFNYEPKFYDEDKQDLQNRKRAIERKVQKMKGEKVDEYVPTRNIKFDSTVSRNSQVGSSIKKSNLRIFVLICLLFGLIYGFTYMMDRVDSFESVFDQWINKN